MPFFLLHLSWNNTINTPLFFKVQQLMALLRILTAPDKRLKKKALPVDTVDDTIRQLMDDMLETMYAAPGIGLAAPQVGISKQVIVIDIDRYQENKQASPLVLANPSIIRAEGELIWKEGCLSVPEYVADITRSAVIEVEALDRDNQKIRLEARELLAVCLQHEIDHLHGLLFIDHISRIKRSMILQKLKKIKKQE